MNGPLRNMLSMVVLGMLPLGSNAAFYDEAQFLPVVESLTFGPGHVGIQVARS